MLSVFNLSFDYQDKPLLKDIRFSIQKGQLLHLRGQNGAGKTTLLKLLAGLLSPLSGEIRYEGRLINDDLRAYQQKLCFVGHRSGVNESLTVKENCYFDLHWGRNNIDLCSMLALFGLEHLENTLCASLSFGQRRRLGLMRTAMTDAPLWLLDEPLTALDEEARHRFMTHLEQHLTQGGLVVATSHQPLPLETVQVMECAL